MPRLMYQGKSRKVHIDEVILHGGQVEVIVRWLQGCLLCLLVAFDQVSMCQQSMMGVEG